MQKVLYEFLHKTIDYDELTGELRWKVSVSEKQRKGKLATPDTLMNGYQFVTICGKRYKAHRLIWLYVHGYFPENDIDHIDRDKTNNKLSNLREISRQCNMRNVGCRVNNTSKVVGVSFLKKKLVWYANIMVNGKTYGLGNHKDYYEAVAHRLAAEQCLNWHKCDSDSSAYQCLKESFKECK